MQKRILTVIVAIGFIASAWQLGRAQGQVAPVAPFTMQIEFTAFGIKAECLKGCAWKKVTYGCTQERTPCKAEIDQLGVGGVK